MILQWLLPGALAPAALRVAVAALAPSAAAALLHAPAAAPPANEWHVSQRAFSSSAPSAPPSDVPDPSQPLRLFVVAADEPSDAALARLVAAAKRRHPGGVELVGTVGFFTLASEAARIGLRAACGARRLAGCLWGSQACSVAPEVRRCSTPMASSPAPVVPSRFRAAAHPLPPLKDVNACNWWRAAPWAAGPPR
jgi:hypothetical protein